MDSAPRKQQKRKLSETLEVSSPSSVPGTIREDTSNELQRTPSRHAGGRGGKRKLQTTPTSSRDEDKTTPSAKKRRSSSSQGISGSPSTCTTPLKPALTERQQLALLLQMTDPQKQTPGGSSVESSPRDTPTRGGRVHRKNERGETPLHLACIKGDKKAASSLVQQGADVNATDFAGWTPLHEACNHGYSDVVMLLLDSGAYINALGMGGDTPLHDAVVNNHVEVVQILLKRGADSTIRNHNGQQPLDVCRDRGIGQLLQSTMGQREEKDEEDVLGRKREEKDSDEDVFLSKSEASGPSSPAPMPTLDSDPSGHVLSSFTTPVMKKPHATEPDFHSHSDHTPHRPPQQRKHSQGSLYSDISSENDHEHTPTVADTGDDNAPSSAVAVRTETSAEVKDQATEGKTQFPLTEGLESSAANEKAALYSLPSARRSLVQSIKHAEGKDVADTKGIPEVSDDPQTKGDLFSSKDDAAVQSSTNQDVEELTVFSHGNEPSLQLYEQISEESLVVASPILSQSPSRSQVTSQSSQDESQYTPPSSPMSPISLTVSFSLDSLPQRGITLGTHILRDTSKPFCKSNIALRRLKDRERRSASVGMTPSLLDDDTRDGSSLAHVTGVLRRLRRQGSISLDSSTIASVRQDSLAYDDDDDSRSTVVSLPLLFSSRHQQSPSPSHHGSSPSLAAGDDLKFTPTSSMGHFHKLKEAQVKNVHLSSSSTSTKKPSPISSTTNKGPFYKEKDEEYPLPPKKQLVRPTIRSNVIQQHRQTGSLPPSLPHNLSSFLLTTRQYRTHQLPSPVNPKCVYPPISPALHKLFCDQELERIALLTSHLTDLDRVALSFEQALVRAHQRAAVHGYPPLSVCSILLEQMSVPTKMMNQSNAENTCLNTPTANKLLSSAGVSDEKLLASYVRDVWDRFDGCSKELLSRHRMEEETLWLNQAHQWREKLKSIEDSGSVPVVIPSSHVPLAHRGNTL